MDFVLVLVLLVPLFLGVLQVALVLFVRNTLASAAAEGARYAATLDRDVADGLAKTHEQLRGVIGGRFADGVRARPALVEGAPGVEIVVHASVPALGLGGPAVDFEVAAHAVEEQP